MLIVVFMVGLLAVAAVPDGGVAGDCATGAAIQTLLLSKKGNLTPQNIFRPVTANGCGYAANAPIAATGAMLIGTVLDELERTGGRYGLVTMCAAGGMAPAVIIERI